MNIDELIPKTKIKKAIAIEIEKQLKETKVLSEITTEQIRELEEKALKTIIHNHVYDKIDGEIEDKKYYTNDVMRDKIENLIYKTINSKEITDLLTKKAMELILEKIPKLELRIFTKD